MMMMRRREEQDDDDEEDYRDKGDVEVEGTAVSVMVMLPIT